MSGKALLSLLQSPAVQGRLRQGIRGGGRLLAQAIKSRRERRRRSGRKVIFPYLEENLRAIRPAKRRRIGTQNATMLNPARVGVVSSNTNSMGMQMSRMEYSVNLLEYSTFHKDFMPLCATQSNYFTALAKFAKAYQFYKFHSISMGYAPNKGTSMNGNFAVTVVANREDVDAITSWSDLINLPHTYYGPVHVKHQMFFGPKCFNSQVSKFKAVDEDKTNGYDPTQVQGWLVYATQDCDGDFPQTVIGKLHTTYRVQLSGPRSAPQSAALSAYVSAADSATLTVLNGKTSPMFVQTGGFHSYDYIVLTAQRPARSDYLVLCHLVGTGLGTLSLTDATGCALTTNVAHTNTEQTQAWMWGRVVVVEGQKPSFRITITGETTLTQQRVALVPIAMGSFSFSATA